MSTNRIFFSIQLIFACFLTTHSQPVNFARLDNVNAFNMEYYTFPWLRSKIAVSFANPVLTKDNFNIQQRLFKELSPDLSFYNFICNEITSTFISKSQFMSAEWHPIPVKREKFRYVHQDEIYSIVLPDSATETYANTGCRFTILFEDFHSEIRYSGEEKFVIPNLTVTDHRNPLKNSAVFSFTYVIYDLLENKIVQFGKSYDDDNSRITTKGKIKQCFNNALMDVLEVSYFYYKK